MQAAAIGAAYQNAELSIIYIDAGTDTLTACWIADWSERSVTMKTARLKNIVITILALLNIFLLILLAADTYLIHSIFKTDFKQ